MKRRPIAAMPWHVPDAGLLVVCDDGSVWWWNNKTGEWTHRADVPLRGV